MDSVIPFYSAKICSSNSYLIPHTWYISLKILIDISVAMVLDDYGDKDFVAGR